MVCKTVLGDRNLSITQKRFQAKNNLIKLYKQQLDEVEALKKGNTSKANLGNDKKD